MRFTSTTVILGLIAAACAVPLRSDPTDVLTARDSSSVNSYNARALSDDATAALSIPRSESSPGNHPSPGTSTPSNEQTIEITCDKAPMFSAAPKPQSAQWVQERVDWIMKQAEQKLNIKGAKFHVINEWKGPANSLKFMFSVPACKGNCQATVSGDMSDGQIISQDGRGLYKHKKFY